MKTFGGFRCINLHAMLVYLFQPVSVTCSHWQYLCCHTCFVFHSVLRKRTPKKTLLLYICCDYIVLTLRMFEFWAVWFKSGVSASGRCTKHFHDDGAGCPPSKIPNFDKNYFNLCVIAHEKWTMTMKLNGLFLTSNLPRYRSLWIAGRYLATSLMQLQCVFSDWKLEADTDDWCRCVTGWLTTRTPSPQKKKRFTVNSKTSLSLTSALCSSKLLSSLYPAQTAPHLHPIAALFPSPDGHPYSTTPPTHTHTQRVHHVHLFKPQKLRQANNCH